MTEKNTGFHFQDAVYFRCTANNLIKNYTEHMELTVSATNALNEMRMKQ